MTTYDTFQVRVPPTLVGNNAVSGIGKEAKKLGARKVLIVTDRGLVQAGMVDMVKGLIEAEGLQCGVFSDCVPDAPTSAVKACARFAKAGQYNLLIGLGGGSVLDTTKLAGVIAAAPNPEDVDMFLYFRGTVQNWLPRIMVPTTAGTGAEWSAVAVITDQTDGVKKAAKHDSLLGEMAIVDPVLTAALPPRLTADTGMDALSHAIEARTSRGLNPFSEALSDMAIRLIAGSLRTAFRGGSPDARYNMALASTVACMAMSMHGAQLTHAMGHVLQTKAACTHGVAVSIVMPHVLEYSMVAGLPAFARLAELLGEKIAGLSEKQAAAKSIQALNRLTLDLGMPQRLRDVGFKKEDASVCADLVISTQARLVGNNIRPVTRDDVKALYEAAW